MKRLINLLILQILTFVSFSQVRTASGDAIRKEITPKYVNGVIKQLTIAQLKAQSISNGDSTTLYYVTDPGKKGYFELDKNDNSSVGNDSTIIVTNNGKRLKRTDDYSKIENGYSISELRALSNQKVAYTKLFWCNEKDKEGFWKYDSSDNSSSDNLGTILVTTGGKRLKRIFNGKIYAAWFGAGIQNNDNGVPINNALSAIQGKDGQVILPSGVLYVRTPVVLNQGSGLIGQKGHYSDTLYNSSTTTLKLQSNTNNNIIECFLNGTTTPVDNSLHSIMIKDIRFDGNKSNNANGLAMYLTSMGETSIVDNCRFVNFKNSTIKIDGHCVPGFFSNINIVNSGKYGFDIVNCSGQLWFSNISIDDCYNGAFNINGSTRGPLSLSIDNLKYEKRASTLSNTSIVRLNNAINSNIRLSNFSSYNYSGSSSEIIDIIKIIGIANQDPLVNASNILNNAGNQRIINDSIRTFQKNISSATTILSFNYMFGKFSNYQDIQKSLYNTVEANNSIIGIDINSTPSIKVYDKTTNLATTQHYMSIGGTHTFDGKRYVFRDSIDAGNNLAVFDKTNGVSLSYSGGKIGFYGISPVSKTTISGKANTVLRDLLGALGTNGLITNLTTNVGYIGIGSDQGAGYSNQSSSSPYLDISWGGGPATAIFGANNNSDARSDNTQKLARLAFPNYSISQSANALIIGDAGSNYNKINIGGGSSLLNSATEINFYNGPSNTTLTGTIYGKFTNGNFILQNGGTYYDTGERLQVNGIALITDKLKLQTGTNKSVGTLALTSGLGTITSTAITTNSIIWITTKTLSGTSAHDYTYNISADGTATITARQNNGSTETGCNSTIQYWIIN